MKRAFAVVACCVVVGAVIVSAAVVASDPAKDRRAHDVQIHLTLTVGEARELLAAAATGTPIPDRTARPVAAAVVRALSGHNPVEPPKPKPLPDSWRDRDIRVLGLDRQSEDMLRSWLPPVRMLGDVADQIEMGSDGLLMFDNHRAERVRRSFADYVGDAKRSW